MPTRMNYFFRAAQKLTISVIAVVLTILVIEIFGFVFKLDFRELLHTGTDVPWTQPINIADPILVHIHKPDLRLSGVQKGGDITNYMAIPDPETYSFNYVGDRRGFRNSETLEQADIAFIGDSFTESILVDQQKIATSLLSNSLKQTVINFGQLWYGPNQELEVLKRFALATKPKWVVWMFYGGNDIDDHRRDKLRYPVWQKEWRQVGSIWSRSLTRNIKQLVHNNLTKEPKRAVRSADCLKAGYQKPVYFWEVLEPFDDKRKQLAAEVFSLLKSANKITLDSGAKLLLVYVPSKYSALSDFCDNKVGLDIGYQDPLPELMQQELASEMPFLDLTSYFKDAASQGLAPYLRDDTHLSEAGNKVVAQAVEGRILELEGN